LFSAAIASLKALLYSSTALIADSDNELLFPFGILIGGGARAGVEGGGGGAVGSG
jgi:hypothetical protein